MYPGGVNETFMNHHHDCLPWESNYLSEMELKNVQIIPVSIIGMNDMIVPLYHVDISPLLWWIGYKDTKQSIPIVYPSSYQRMYMNIGSPASLHDLHSFNSSEIVLKGMNELVTIRELDKGRFLLTFVGTIVSKGNQIMWSLLDLIEFKTLAKRGGKKMYEWGVACLESY